MRRLARGATILAQLLLTQRAGTAGLLRAHGRIAFATRQPRRPKQIDDALAYDYMAYALVPDLTGSPRPAQSAPGQQIRVRW